MVNHLNIAVCKSFAVPLVVAVSISGWKGDRCAPTLAQKGHSFPGVAFLFFRSKIFQVENALSVHDLLLLLLLL